MDVPAGGADTYGRPDRAAIRVLIVVRSEWNGPGLGHEGKSMAWQERHASVIPLGQSWEGPRLPAQVGEGAARSLGATLVVLSGRSDAEVAGEINPALPPGVVGVWRSGGAAMSLAEFLALLRMTGHVGLDALRGFVLD